MEEKTERIKGKLMYQRKREKGEGKANKEYIKQIISKTINYDQKGNEKDGKELEERTENFTQTNISKEERRERVEKELSIVESRSRIKSLVWPKRCSG